MGKIHNMRVHKKVLTQVPHRDKIRMEDGFSRKLLMFFMFSKKN